MTVYFENSYGDIRKIANVSDDKEAMLAIHRFLEEHRYISYYQRLWNTKVQGKDMTTIDVGSHTEFFHVEPPII